MTSFESLLDCQAACQDTAINSSPNAAATSIGARCNPAGYSSIRGGGTCGQRSWQSSTPGLARQYPPFVKNWSTTTMTANPYIRNAGTRMWCFLILGPRMISVLGTWRISIHPMFLTWRNRLPQLLRNRLLQLLRNQLLQPCKNPMR